MAASKRVFHFEDLGDGTVRARVEVAIGPLRVSTEMDLDQAQRDELFEVLTRARSRDPRPEDVTTIARRRTDR